MNQAILANDQVHLPRGPKGSLFPTLKLIRNPRKAMEAWVKEFGDPFLLKALNGPVVVTGREDLIRTIHGQDPNIYETFANQTTGPILGLGSMLILHGDRHRRERRMMTPIFHGDRTKAYGPTMQAIALEQIEKHNPNGTISTIELMTDISLEVIIRLIFGGEDLALVEQMFAASKKLMSRANPLLFFTRKSHFSCLGISPWDRWRSAKADLIHLLDSAIDQRLQSDEQRNDILALLCQARYEDGQPMSREDIHSELLTFLFAGHETTALSMTWAIYHIHRDPCVLERLRSELDLVSDTALEQMVALPYLKAVIQETLRINPLVTETLRKLRAPMELGEYRLPAGIAIAPATVLAHYNPEVYPEPDQFRPERFLEGSFTPFEFMPFGGGHRRCIGAAFATYEMAMVLGSLLRQYDFTLLDKTEVVPKRRSVTMGPSSEIPVNVCRRAGQ
jgi:cytochrome P450